MRPEPQDPPERVSARALELWTTLSGLYDQIDAALTDSARRADLGDLGRAVVEVETDLRPLVARIAELRTQGAGADEHLQEIWQQSDRVVADLRVRQPALTRAAIAARDGAEKALAKVRAVRLESNAYRQQGGAEPRFAPRQA